VRAKKDRLTPNQRLSIKDFVRRKLIGAEIVTESSDEMVLQILFSYPELSAEAALRRMLIMASSMHRDALLALKSLDKELASNVISTDDEVDRFNIYVVRLLKLALRDSRLIRDVGLESLVWSLGYRIATASLEEVADQAVKMARNVLALEKPPADALYRKILEYGQTGIALLEGALTALFKEDYALAEKVASQTEGTIAAERKIVEAMLEPKQRLDAKTLSCLRLILESSKRVAECGKDIAEVALNRTVEGGLTKSGPPK